MEENKDNRTRILRWFSNPLIGIVGSVASIIGIFLSIYLYISGSKYPDLTFCVHPIRTTILSKEAGNNLTFNFMGKKVETEISVARIAIWNRGSQSIRKEDILSPIGIQIASEASIIEAKVLSTSREIIDFEILDKEKEKGRIILSWKILEKNDGAIIQIIYASDSLAKIQPYGAIEEQRNLSQTTFFKTIKSAKEQFSDNTNNILLIVLLIPMFCDQILIFIKNENRRSWFNLIQFCLILTMGALIIIGIYTNYVENWPQFGN